MQLEKNFLLLFCGLFSTAVLFGCNTKHPGDPVTSSSTGVAPIGLTEPQAGVIATNPATAPMTIPSIVAGTKMVNEKNGSLNQFCILLKNEFSNSDDRTEFEIQELLSRASFRLAMKLNERDNKEDVASTGVSRFKDAFKSVSFFFLGNLNTLAHPNSSWLTLKLINKCRV